MKTTIISFLLIIIYFTAKAQAPQGISYQAVVRDNNGNIIANQQVRFRFTIIQDASNGLEVYQEIQNVYTNSMGLVNLFIGYGVPYIGSLSNIDWANHMHFLKVEIDPLGGNNFIELGLTQLVSVPYAFYANICGNAVSYTAGNGINIANGIISNTAPDQIIVINGQQGISVSGNYPNFTIEHTAHNGDVSGTNTLTVTGIQGKPISSNTPQNNNILFYNGTMWMPVDAATTICSYFQFYYADRDNDTYGDKYAAIFSCTQPLGYVDNNLDFNDNDSTINPTAPEICDGKDNNQDGIIDPENSLNCTLFYYDADNDNYGLTNNFKCLCSAIGLYRAQNGGDCNDNDPNIKPNSSEMCNNVDDNCNGLIDEENAIGCIIYYFDLDNDGFGVNNNFKCLCSPQGYYRTQTPGDCNDNNVNINPSKVEVCDGVDNNCNNQIDEEGSQGCTIYYKDIDSDSYGIYSDTRCYCSSPTYPYTATQFGDCNDNDPTINPGSIEKCNNKDDNCNGVIDEENAQGCVIYYYDADNDGYGITTNKKCLCSVSGMYKATHPGDCNDNNPYINPGVTEKCSNFIDDNCNGQIDETPCTP
ncbi:MAG: putative metal-binding motif-containing protein [Bacteroidales bacterium]|nr:putative metal-binding motif-containing protein [Bacteroidales bacterium]